jgi:hypothetical protein
MPMTSLRYWCLALLPVVALAAQPQLPHPEAAGRSLRKLTTQGQAMTPNGAADGQLDLYAGKGGLNRLAFTLYKAGEAAGPSFIDSIKAFHFRDFEGPDAPAAARRLTQVTVRGKAGVVQVRLRQNGYYSAEVKGGFVFDTGVAGPRDRIEIQKLRRALRAGADGLVVRISDSKDPRVWVQGEFAAAGLFRKRLVGN